jgi:hypothetical protein
MQNSTPDTIIQEPSFDPIRGMMLHQGKEVFQIKAQYDNACILRVTQEFPRLELWGLMFWDDGLQMYKIFQVGVVRLPLPQLISRAKDAPAVLRGLLSLVPQPECKDCVGFDTLRSHCTKRRDPQVDWLDCYLEVSAGDRACSRFVAI